MLAMHSYVLYNRLLAAGAKEASTRGKKSGGKMGGAQTSSSTGSPSSHSDYHDGPSLHPTLIHMLSSGSQRGKFSSIDRGLKAFLRSSNLSGLEYRLKMAGYHTVSDLLEATSEALCAKGFTPLMARRLLSALEIYIQRQLDKTEGTRLPFQVVRQNQKIKSEPSESVKALPTYGRRNIKRQRSVKDVSQPKLGANTRPAYVHLMSEETLPSEPIFPNVIDNRRIPDEGCVVSHMDVASTEGVAQYRSDVTQDRIKSSASVYETQYSDDVTWYSNDVTQKPSMDSDSTHDQIPSVGVAQYDNDVTQSQAGPSVGVVSPSRQRWTMFEEYSLDDIDTADVHSDFSFLSQKLERSQSVPADYWYQSHSCPRSPVPYSWYRVRAYSCPPRLPSLATPIEQLVTALSSSQDAVSAYPALCGLLKLLRTSHDSTVEVVVNRGGGEAVVEVLQTLYAYHNVVEKCCHIVKYLARSATLPPEAAPSLLLAMDSHSCSERVQTQGSLALGNLIRTDPTQCSNEVFTGALRTLSTAMEAFPSSLELQVSVLAALAVLLSTDKERRLLLITEYGHLLDLVLLIMESFTNGAQLQQYTCSFLALLTAEVGAQIESGVMQLILEHIAIAMTTHPRDSHVNYWSAKVITNAATNAALSDLKLALRCSELLVESLVTFSGSPGLQKWCSYGLLQLSSQHRRVKEMVQQSNCLSRVDPATEEDKPYVDQLKETIIGSK